MSTVDVTVDVKRLEQMVANWPELISVAVKAVACNVLPDAQANEVTASEATGEATVNASASTEHPRQCPCPPTRYIG